MSTTTRSDPLMTTLGGTASEAVELATLPKARLARRVRTWLVAALLVQGAVSAAALLALQGPWRARSRFDGADTAAALAADRLGEHALIPGNPLVQEALDSITSAPGVDLAAIIDADGHIEFTSGNWADSPSNGALQVGATISPDLAATEGVTTTSSGAIFLAAPIGADGAHHLILGMPDPAVGRALTDGGVAILAGFFGTCLVAIPTALRQMRRSTGGLHELHRAIRRLSRGIVPEPVAVQGDDEIAYLAVAFNDMAADIIRSQALLREANAVLEQRVIERTEQLRCANLALEAKNVALAEVTETALRFTDDVAHELRTPLAVILEFASLIDDGLAGPVTPEQTQHLAFIADAATELTQLVDDFLDTSRLRAGRLPVHRRPHSAESLLDAAWVMLEAKAAGRQVRLRRAMEPDLPIVLADISMARRVLINLVVNAIKFSKAGDEVVIEARAWRDGIQIRVIDHGAGMSETEIDRLFERFRQTASGARASSKGFGLGLSITAQLVAINLGEITVQSRQGVGSTFAFTLPENDPHMVLDRHLARLKERTPTCQVAALMVRDPGSQLSQDALCERLIDIGNPWDLQLPGDDDHSILLVGRTDDAGAWRSALAAVGEAACVRNEEPVNHALRLETDHVGCWPIASTTAGQILAAVALAGKEAAHCA